jgi:hypothetical protein
MPRKRMAPRDFSKGLLPEDLQAKEARVVKVMDGQGRFEDLETYLAGGEIRPPQLGESARYFRPFFILPTLATNPFGITEPVVRIHSEQGGSIVMRVAEAEAIGVFLVEWANKSRP